MVCEEGMGVHIRPLVMRNISTTQAPLTTPSAIRPPCMPDHECHLFRRDIFSGDNEVALIFTVLRVEHHDELPVA